MCVSKLIILIPIIYSIDYATRTNYDTLQDPEFIKWSVFQKN